MVSTFGNLDFHPQQRHGNHGRDANGLRTGVPISKLIDFRKVSLIFVIYSCKVYEGAVKHLLF